jgi:hypothetical protein
MRLKFSFVVACAFLAATLPLAGALLAQDTQAAQSKQEQSQGSRQEAKCSREK